MIYRIYRLLDEQKQKLVQFLLSDVTPPPHECPLPILPSDDNRQESAIQSTGIYRDPWERQLRSLDEGDMRVKDVVDTWNYLSFEDWREATKRGRRERNRRSMGGSS